MELNAAPLTASPVDIFSLIPILGNNPAISTKLSASPAQDFSALLTEMTGTGTNPVTVPTTPAAALNSAPTATLNTAPNTIPNAIPALTSTPAPAAAPVAPATIPVMPPATGPAAISTTAPITVLATVPGAAPVIPPAELPAVEPPALETPNATPVAPQISNTGIQGKGKEQQKAPEAQKPTTSDTVAASFLPFVPVVFNSAAHLTSANNGKDLKLDDAQPQIPQLPQVVAQQAQPELERAFADLKKFEYTVKPDTEFQPGTLQVTDAAGLPADPAKAAVAVVTDPILTVQQQQMPPRILAVQKVAAETKPSDRNKTASSSEADSTATTTTAQSSDLVRPVELADQVAAANPIEIPNIPHLPVVRSVAMEVGDPGSQVTIHIQERGGDISMQLNTASDPLHQDLQSSAGSLVQSLKQEQVQVSNVEVTRKSPIEKVRRMKEAR